MSKDEFANFTEWNQKAFEALQRVTETNMRIGEQIMQEQANVMQSLAADAANAYEAINATSDVKEMVAKQSDLAEKAGKKLVQSACSCANIVAAASKTYADMFAENYEAANQATKSAVEKAAKKAA